MGRFAIQTSPRLADVKATESMTELARNTSSIEMLPAAAKPTSRFKRASDDVAAELPVKESQPGGGTKEIFNTLDTRGRFHVSSVELSDKTTIIGVDSELISLATQDPTAGISHLSLEEKYVHLLGHCNKQRGLIEQLLSIIKQNSGDGSVKL